MYSIYNSTVWYLNKKNCLPYDIELSNICNFRLWTMYTVNFFSYPLFFQTNNTMQFKNYFLITVKRPLSAILRSFVQTPLIIVWTTLTTIYSSFLLILTQSLASFFAFYPLTLHEPAKPTNFQWVRPEGHWRGYQL
jgi:hypothetical protein